MARLDIAAFIHLSILSVMFTFLMVLISFLAVLSLCLCMPQQEKKTKNKKNGCLNLFPYNGPCHCIKSELK